MDMKTSKRIPPRTPKYHRLTSEKCVIIWTLKKECKIAVKAAKRRGGTRPPGQAWPSAHIRRSLRLKPALLA